MQNDHQIKNLDPHQIDRVINQSREHFELDVQGSEKSLKSEGWDE